MRENWNPYARKYIAKVEDTLKEMGCFEDIDKFNLDMLGDALTLYLAAKEEIEQDGIVITDTHGRLAANPAVGLVKNQQSVIISLWKELSISLRQRRFLQKDQMITDESPLSELLNMVNNEVD